MNKLKDKKILVGVTGGIAAYKTCSLVNKLISDGADVRVVMTDSATKFVTSLTFQSLTNQPVYTNLWDPIGQDGIEHIDISHWPDIILISPTTANCIAKIANGFADDLLTTVISAKFSDTKVLIAPAMNTNMWDSAANKRNVETLRSEKSFFVMEPREGILACRDEGKGKVPSIEEIYTKITELID